MTDEKTYHYPWARALMIVVLYGALLVFLWHFPTEGGRAFFQTLMRGFLYILAGLALVAVTFIFFLLFPLPPLRESADQEAREDEDACEEDYQAEGGVYSARTLLVPQFKNADVEARVWNILYDLEADLNPDCIITADARAGIITVTDDDEEEASDILHLIRARLKNAGISVRSAH